MLIFLGMVNALIATAHLIMGNSGTALAIYAFGALCFLAELVRLWIQDNMMP
jgi:hypothetical protein